METVNLKFEGNKYAGWAASVFCHFLVVLGFFPAFEYAWQNQAGQVSHRSELATIEVEVVPDIIAYRPQEQVLQTRQQESVPADEPANNGATKAEEATISMVPTNDMTASPEPERYEQILSRHLLNSLQMGAIKINRNDIVDIWIKINKNGKIIDHAIITEVHDQDLKYALKQILENAGLTLPVPPETEFKKGYTQYLVPLLLRK